MQFLWRRPMLSIVDILPRKGMGKYVCSGCIPNWALDWKHAKAKTLDAHQGHNVWAVRAGKGACSAETCNWVLGEQRGVVGELMNLFEHHKFKISRRNWALYGSIYHTFHFRLAEFEWQPAYPHPQATWSNSGLEKEQQGLGAEPRKQRGVVLKQVENLNKKRSTGRHRLKAENPCVFIAAFKMENCRKGGILSSCKRVPTYLAVARMFA